MSKIGEFGYELIPHPTYSPDLAPCDYWLYRVQSVSQWMKQTGIDFFAEGIQKIPERWRTCVNVKGEWFEKVDTE